MRQPDFILSKALVTRKAEKRRMIISSLANAPLSFTLRSFKKLKRGDLDLRNINFRSLCISTYSFNIDIYSDESVLRDIRFRAKDIARITTAMGWIQTKTHQNRYKCSFFTACCIVLCKLAYPCRWKDLDYVFGMRSSALTKAFWEALETFADTHGHQIGDVKEAFIVSRAKLYANGIRNAGAPLDSCVGFIDCTKIQMCRPSRHGGIQKSCYSGHKRFHCLIYQTATTPDGLIFDIYGPEVGRRHDVTLLRESGLRENLASCLQRNGRQVYIYGDAAYMLHPGIQIAFDNSELTEAQQNYNTVMSAIRVTLEWSHKYIKQLWSFTYFPRALKVRQKPIPLIYKTAALLQNFKVCIDRWGQVNGYFDCSPPTLSQYSDA